MVGMIFHIELPTILGDDCLHITVLRPILTEVDKKLGLSADPQKDEPHTGINLLYSHNISHTCNYMQFPSGSASLSTTHVMNYSSIQA